MTQQEVLAKLHTEMEIRGFSEATINSYSTQVRYFQKHYNQSAFEMHEKEVREFLHYQITEKGNLGSSVNKYNSTLRFLYDLILDKPLNSRFIPRAKETRRIPILPTKNELHHIFSRIRNQKYFALFITIYGSGLRLSEAAKLKITDIDSKNMRIIIRKGKGGKDRFALLPIKTLVILRDYYKAYKPKDYLFENGRGNRLTTRAIQNAFVKIVESAGTQKHITVHTLRHAFATHLLNDGANIYEIKKLLGHIRIDTTSWYLQLSDQQILGLTSPLDSMDFSSHLDSIRQPTYV